MDDKQLLVPRHTVIQCLDGPKENKEEVWAVDAITNGEDVCSARLPPCMIIGETTEIVPCRRTTRKTVRKVEARSRGGQYIRAKVKETHSHWDLTCYYLSLYRMYIDTQDPNMSSADMYPLYVFPAPLCISLKYHPMVVRRECGLYRCFPALVMHISLLLFSGSRYLSQPPLFVL